jgi:hypothetical protein
MTLLFQAAFLFCLRQKENLKMCEFENLKMPSVRISIFNSHMSLEESDAFAWQFARVHFQISTSSNSQIGLSHFQISTLLSVCCCGSIL